MYIRYTFLFHIAISSNVSDISHIACLHQPAPLPGSGDHFAPPVNVAQHRRGPGSWCRILPLKSHEMLISMVDMDGYGSNNLKSSSPFQSLLG